MFEKYFDTVVMSTAEQGKHEIVNNSAFRENFNSVQEMKPGITQGAPFHAYVRRRD